jgi:hypothetical protein
VRGSRPVPVAPHLGKPAGPTSVACVACLRLYPRAQTIGAADASLPVLLLRMERDSGSVTAVFHGCRSAAGPNCAPADAWSSSNAGASHTSARTLASGREQQCFVTRCPKEPAVPSRTLTLRSVVDERCASFASRLRVRWDLRARFLEGVGDRVLEVQQAAFAGGGIPCVGPAPCAGGLEERFIEPGLDRILVCS